MRFLLCFFLSWPAIAEDLPPLRAMVVTCDTKYLPLPEEAAGYRPGLSEVSGIVMGSLSDVDKLVKPESYHGGGFVEFDKDMPCAILTQPRYVATIWNPKKTKVWCAVYEGVFASPRDCIPAEPVKK